MDQLVSIIVPVYKVEDYLPACIDSILSQTHPHLQIILVDDGSPDGCGTICDSYAKTDPRVTVIHKKNGGLSDARNAGMAVATGDYLMFVDSDDILPSDAVGTLLELAIAHCAPLVIGAHARFEDAPLLPADQPTSFSVLSRIDAIKDMFLNGCAAWARIYRKELHEDILFPYGEINEDEAIVLQLLERCDRVVKTEKIVYHYRYRPESITTAAFHNKKMAWMRHCKDNWGYVQKHHPASIPDAVARYRESLLWGLTEIALSDQAFPEETRELRRDLRQNRKIFRYTPFRFPQDRIRMEFLMYLPFCFYKNLLRLKRTHL